MKHTQLRAFHQVALLGGFSRAAAAMGLTQPAVSDAVARLEATYDVLLFDRRKKQVRLTRRGEQLLALTRPLFETEARTLEFLTESRALTFGHLRVIADSAYHVTDILSRFRKTYPAVRITLKAGNSAEVSAALAAYEADIGVLGNVTQGALYSSIPLGSSPIIGFAAKGFLAQPSKPQPLASLLRYPLVLREAGSRTRQKLEETARALGLSLAPAIEAAGREAVREIVASGAGIGFVSEAEFGHDARLIKLPIKGVTMLMSETVVALRARSEVRLIRAFLALTKAVIT
jgi:LysR family transcriptional regulator, low CO2-responsive transcriptional regulator